VYGIIIDKNKVQLNYSLKIYTMKKIILLLLIGSSTLSLYAQDMTDTTQAGKTKMKSDDSKTKIKDDKAKFKDADGKIKIKDSDDMNSDMDSKTKIKDDKVKIKDADGKVKIKGEGNMNTSTGNSAPMTNAGMANGTMNTSTNVNVVSIGGWTTNPANLPVVGNNVPADVVTNIKNKYGTTIYDIKQIRSTSGQNIFVVRIMENGAMRSDYVGNDGNMISQ
jgi:Sec-independent protein translocase protein TatA